MTINKIFLINLFLITILSTANVNSAGQNNIDSEKIIYLKNQVKDDPDNAQARYLLAKIYQKNNNIKGAENEFKKALNLEPGSSKIRFDYAELLLENWKYQELYKVLDQSFAIEEKEKESKRLALITFAYLGEGKISQAKKTISQAKYLKNTDKVQLALAKIAAFEGDYKKAAVIIEQLLKKSEDNFDILLLKARLAEHQKHYKQAQTIYKELLIQKPGNLFLLIRLAHMKYNLKQYKTIEKDLNAILNHNNLIPQANFLMALVKYSQGDYNAAEQFGQKVLSIVSDHYESMYIIGRADFKLKRMHQAEKYFTKILFRYPDDLEVQYTLARIYLSQNKAEQALPILESITKEQLEKNPKVYMMLGKMYLMLNNNDKARDVFYAIKKIVPNDTLLIKNLIQLQLALGDIDNAILELKKLDQNVVEKSSLDIQFLRVMSYIKDEKLIKAKSLLAELKKIAIDDPNIYSLSGDLAFAENMYDSASTLYHEALKIAPKFIPAYLGLSKIALFNRQDGIADSYLQNILSIDEYYVQAYLARADIAENMGKLDIVENILREGVNKISHDMGKQLKIYNALAKFYIKHKQSDKLEKLGQEFITKHPHKIQAFLFQVKILFYNNKKKKQVIKVLTEFINKHPLDIEENLQLVALLINNHEKELALDLLNRILDNNPDHVQSILIKSRLLIQYGYIDELNMFLKQYINEEEKNIKQVYHFALAAQQQKDYKQALQYYKILIGYQPGNTILLNNMAWIYSLYNNPKAIALAKKAYTLQPESVAIADTYSTILLKNAHYKQALIILKKAASISSDNMDVQYHLAQAYYLNKMNNKAVPVLQKILTAEHNFPEKHNAQLLLNKIK